MRSMIKFGACALVVLASTSMASPTATAKQPTAADQVQVLLRWYKIYFEEGKYKQAQQVAELAYELAPDNPETAVALKVAHRVQAGGFDANAGQKLEQVMQKLDRLEKQLREREAQAVRRARIQLTREPPGSPDRQSSGD